MSDFTFQDYTGQLVYQKITAAQQTEIIDFWTKNRAISIDRAQDRVAEVVYTIRNAADQLIGVTTASIKNLTGKNNPYYFFRIFIKPGERRNPILLLYALQNTCKFLRHYQHPDSNPLGIVIIAENQKLSRPGLHRALKNRDWNHYGKGPRGNDVWYINFDGSQIEHQQT